MSEAMKELRGAFEAWARDHGPIWFAADERLAEALAAVLGVDLVWGAGVNREDSE